MTEYVLGSLPFFVRWFVRVDNVEGSKERGVETVTKVAQHGRYDVGLRDVLHGWIRRLLQRQRVVGIGNDLAIDTDRDVLAGRLDGDRMGLGGLKYGAIAHE